MSRNRVIYQSEALYVGPSPATGNHFTSGNSGVNLVSGLSRIQSANYGFNFNRTDVNQFGELAAIDRVQLEAPTVTLDFSYILASFANERRLGFTIGGATSALSGILNKTQDEKNYFIKTTPEGTDANSNTTEGSTISHIGIGNGFLASYSSQASVGSFATVDVRLEALNMLFANGISGQLPAVHPESGTRITSKNFTLPTMTGNPGTGELEITALRPGDITMSFRRRVAEDPNFIATGEYVTAGADLDEAKIQGYTLSFDLSREQIQKLGSRFPFSREIVFPASINLSVDAVLSELTTGSLDQLINCDDEYDILIKLYQPPTCSSSSNPVMCQYHIKGAKVDGESFSSSIGANKTVQLNFSAQFGGPNDTSAGLYLSGISQNGGN